MGPFRARVKNGRLVVDEPTELPEGTVYDLVIFDEGDDLDDEERRALDEALADSAEQAKRGEVVDAEDFIRELRRRWGSPSGSRSVARSQSPHLRVVARTSSACAGTLRSGAVGDLASPQPPSDGGDSVRLQAGVERASLSAPQLALPRVLPCPQRPSRRVLDLVSGQRIWTRLASRAMTPVRDYRPRTR